MLIEYAKIMEKMKESLVQLAINPFLPKPETRVSCIRSVTIKSIVYSIYPFWGCNSFVFEAPNCIGFASVFFCEVNWECDILPFDTALFFLVFFNLHFFIFIFDFKFGFAGHVFSLAFVFTNVGNGCSLNWQRKLCNFTRFFLNT